MINFFDGGKGGSPYRKDEDRAIGEQEAFQFSRLRWETPKLAEELRQKLKKQGLV
jgi:hypothetical protein